MADQMQIDIKSLQGYCKMRTWFEPRVDERGECLVGMGETSTFDRNGILVSKESFESGVVLRWDSEEEKRRSIFQKLLDMVRRWI